MDPIGSVGRGWLMGPLSPVVSRSAGGEKHADESPSRRRGPRALVSVSVSPRPRGPAVATGVPPPDHDSYDALDRPRRADGRRLVRGRTRPGLPARRSGAGLRDVGGLDVEAEHHAALLVLGDVAVRHPAA